MWQGKCEGPIAASRSSAERRKGVGLELLEPRYLKTLLGLALDYPAISYDSGGVVNYTAVTVSFDSSTTPLAVRFNPVDPPRLIQAPRSSMVHIRVSNTGALLGGIAGNDLLIQGDVDADGDSVIDYSGTLLTGEILQFGYLDSLDADQYEFLFQPTGGQLFPYFAGKDIGVRMTSVNSTFQNSFATDFGGGAQGVLGPIVPEPTLASAATVALLAAWCLTRRSSPEMALQSATPSQSRRPML